LAQQCFTGTGRTDDQNVRLGDFDIVFALFMCFNAFEWYAQHRENALGAFLADHIVIEEFFDVAGKECLAGLIIPSVLLRE